ncbi:MAG: twin-arginine translocase TatA/TatE family subunit [Phycisphaerae bacterium]|nr:twin-arginine translocase TatA/TatE family subunit [Phycisphaerae bacterium]
MLVVGAVALLVFGNKLPDVGRSLGKGLVEFKKGIKGVKDEMDQVDHEVDVAAEASLEAESKQDETFSGQNDENDETDETRKNKKI